MNGEKGKRKAVFSVHVFISSDLKLILQWMQRTWWSPLNEEQTHSQFFNVSVDSLNSAGTVER